MRLRAVIYRKAHHFLEFREAHDLWFTLIEFAAATLGTIAFVHELHEHGWEAIFSAEWLEVGLFLLLMISIAARLFYIWRARSRGPSFRELVGLKRKAPHFDFDAVLALKPTKGRRGAVLKKRHSNAAIHSLAREAASVFSERTYGEPDGYWEYWEAAYLQSWYEVLPDTIWHIPFEGSNTAGYYSVALPLTQPSAERIERGHLPTALATIESEVNHGNGASGVPLLAYTTQYVPIEQEKPNPRLLLYAALEHLGWLIEREVKGVLREGKGRGIHIICESSNRSLDDLLVALGFQPVTRLGAATDDEIVRKQIKSPAGFKLFKFVHSGDVPFEGSLLMRMIVQIAALPPASMARRAAAERRTKA